MKLLIVRHGKAEDRADWAKTGQPDEDRPLTDEGRKDLKKSMPGLHEIVGSLTGIYSSHLTRARGTAELLSTEFDREMKIVRWLTPNNSPESIGLWLGELDGEGTFALVGHEPGLSMLAAWLLTGGTNSFIELKKGMAILVEFDGPPEKGKGRLLWAAPPKILKNL